MQSLLYSHDEITKKRIETFRDLIITPKERLAIFDVNMTSCSLLCWLVYLCIKKKNKSKNFNVL